MTRQGGPESSGQPDRGCSLGHSQLPQAAHLRRPSTASHSSQEPLQPSQRTPEVSKISSVGPERGRELPKVTQWTSGQLPAERTQYTSTWGVAQSAGPTHMWMQPLRWKQVAATQLHRPAVPMNTLHRGRPPGHTESTTPGRALMWTHMTSASPETCGRRGC